jgi:hypothetical protein
MPERNLTVLSHWATSIENMAASPKEFYERVEQAVQKRKIPDIRITLVSWKESGILSASRTYLRVVRGRYLYDICAAPFGNGFFFSSWMTERLPSPLWAIAGFIISLLIGFYSFFLLIYFVRFLGFLIWVSGVFGTSVVFIILLSQSESPLGEYVFVVPYIGPFLEKICRPNTYFRRDTESMFHSMVHNALLEAVDATTKEKGARELTSDERKPVLREFFQR